MSLPILGLPLHRVLLRRPLSYTLLSRLDWIVQGGCLDTGKLQVKGLGRNSASELTEGCGKGKAGLEREIDDGDFKAGGGVKGRNAAQNKNSRENPERKLGGRAAGKKRWGRDGVSSSNGGDDSLLSLLRSTGHARDIPRKASGKVDLSHVDPLEPRRRSNKDRYRLAEPGRALKRSYFGGVKVRYIDQDGIQRERYSLKSITMSLIYHIYKLYPHSSFRFPVLESAGNLSEDHDEMVLRGVFTSGARDYLEQRGYTPEDVLVWAWVLTARDGGLAGHRLDLGTRVRNEMVDRSLEEQDILDAELPGEERVQSSHGGEDLDSDDTKNMQLSSPRNTTGARHTYRIPPFLILFTLRRKYFIRDNVRALFPMIESVLFPSNHLSISEDKTTVLLLLRLLRRVRSTWPPAISIVAKLLVTHLHRPDTSRPRSPSRLTRLYNRLLTCFSLPTPDGPFAHLPILQRSQFLILRKMAAMGIPLVREGYRAIVIVQLAHAKTPPEKQTVRDMVTTWPPWPFERDGREGLPPRISRAAEVIQRMTEAGYPLHDWEYSALVLAGKDTDNTPTIQTRTFHLRLRHLISSSPTSIWASRIRATRTIDEAWAIFLDCRQNGTIPRRDVWEELIAKALYAEKLTRQQMHADCIKRKRPLCEKPRLDTLSRLQRESNYRVVAGEAKEVLPPPRNINEGVYVPIPPPDTDELFMMMKRDNVPPSPRLLALLISHSSDLNYAHRILETWGYPLPSPSPSAKPTDPRILTAYISLLLHRRNDEIELAIRLLLAHKLTYTPAYNATLTRLARTLDSRKANDKPNRIRIIWEVYKKMTRLVSEDSQTLRALCVAAEKNIRLGANVLWDGIDPVDQVIHIFETNIGLHKPKLLIADEELPPLLTPSPATLHAYVRLLGFSRRYRDIGRIIEWAAAADWLDDGDKPMARRVMVAARVFLEVPAGKQGEQHQQGEESEDSVRREVLRDIGILVREWPDGEEVAEYCLLGGLRWISPQVGDGKGGCTVS
ncbi:unnamed protein product [Tuber melanosporum]|uniref:(Perigord truffle) hypothetical protein n=1 Tax=Tuber melanosporum (strain Mel28) TaxID=656061 RepID=D5GGM8_TUBMM|nr:uncharacterized protein GSTUM_00007429001 [Tuber melanosporum]CAZ83650.1 unnamed protein product [Tuber melanosporum]